MSSRQAGLWDRQRSQMTDSIHDALNSLNAYLPRYEHLAFAFSGGKDSTAALTFALWAIEAGKVPRPKRVTVLYSDTRMEAPPLHQSAMQILDDCRQRGYHARVVTAPIKHRLLVYWLGQGVPAPSNRMRWCTDKIKVMPIEGALGELSAGEAAVLGKPLVITGVRMGESAKRDDRITLSCSRDGAECGQGWFQESLPAELCDKLAPLLTWRVCHVFEWCRTWAPQAEYGDWDTRLVAEVYGGDEAEELAARTGCSGCPVASEDKGLRAIVRRVVWACYAPLLDLRPLFWRMREPRYRLRQPGGERRKDGQLCTNQQRLGPMTLDARAEALDAILDIERRVNEAARATRQPEICLLNGEELACIRETWERSPWPEGWTGTEPRGDVEMDRIFANGHVQPLLQLGARRIDPGSDAAHAERSDTTAAHSRTAGPHVS